MKSKHKQSSLLSFFQKPKASLKSTSTADCVAAKAESNQINKDGTEYPKDVDDPILNPSSPAKTSLDASLVSPPDTTKNENISNSTKGSNDENTTTSNESDDSCSSDENNSEEDEPTKEDEVPTKSAYELLRERNIERNNARLRSLGLLTDNQSTQNNTKPVRKKRPVKRKKVERVSYPTRRSSRRKTNIVGDEDDANTILNVTNDAAVEVENCVDEEETFVVSALFEYDMNGPDTNPFADFAYKGAGVDSDQNDSKVLVPRGPRLIPPSGLNAIYSLQFYPGTWNGEDSLHPCPSCLVGAGKSGIVSLWNCSNKPENGGIDPILSWKAHGGRWIADAKFLPASDATCNEGVNHIPQRLLTAANDGTICHWDLASHSVHTGAPKLLGRTDKTLHSSGIFSMDVCVGNDTVIASGSKDKTIAVSTIDRFGEAYWRSEFHSAKVGCVSLSSSGILIASASDDGLIAVHDTRSNSVSITVEDAHFKPHSAIWHPESDSSVFLTAGLDTTIKLWDCRNASSPLAQFHGHVVPQNGKKMKRIHRPTFLSLGSESYILSGGEGSHSLSMFECSNGNDGTLHSVFHRGKLPEDHGDAGSVTVLGDLVAVAGEGGEVLILSPKA